MFRFPPFFLRALMAAYFFAAVTADAQHMADKINPAPDRRVWRIHEAATIFDDESLPSKPLNIWERFKQCRRFGN